MPYFFVIQKATSKQYEKKFHEKISYKKIRRSLSEESNGYREISLKMSFLETISKISLTENVVCSKYINYIFQCLRKNPSVCAGDLKE